jgi:hypothetical protein
LGLVLLLIAVGITALEGRQYLEAIQLLATMEDQEAALQRGARHQFGADGLDGQDLERISREVTQANEVLRRISLPWSELFRTLDSAISSDVVLLSMEPDPGKQLVKISGEAKDVAAMLAYVHLLEGQAMFRDATLMSHQVQQQDPQRPIRFAVVASWRDQP